MKIPSSPAQLKTPPALTADVILLDLIGYTLRPNEKQYQALYYLDRIISTITTLLDMRAMLHGEPVIRRAIPNGDGCYLVLNPRISGYGPLLALFLRNFLLFNDRYLNNLFGGVRTSVHHGEVIPVSFLGTENFVGAGLNVCARLLTRPVDRRAADFYQGESNFVIASQAAWQAFQELFPPDQPKVQTYLEKIRFRASRDFAVRDKHRELPVHRGRFIDCARLIGSAPPKPKTLLAS